VIYFIRWLEGGPVGTDRPRRSGRRVGRQLVKIGRKTKTERGGGEPMTPRWKSAVAVLLLSAVYLLVIAGLGRVINGTLARWFPLPGASAADSGVGQEWVESG